MLELNEKKLGFGCMRLPMLDGPEGEVDQALFNRMVDSYMRAGFNYFDTAHVYLDGKSELALRAGLVQRYPRDSFFLVDKLSGSQFQRESEIRPFFERQLKAMGVEYFDLYLMHSLSDGVYEKFTECNAFEQVRQLQAEGRVRHMGISFHDKPQILERILEEHPEIEAVQIQLNYLDYDSPSIESGAVYEVCRQFGKPVLVMEPVKGGSLTDLPEEAERIFADLQGGSPASYAIRYAASFPEVKMVLSGMSTLEQMEDNISYMRDFQPLTGEERAAIEQVRAILKAENSIACTGCRYCTAGCPSRILIPDLLACLNAHRRKADWNSEFYYEVHTKDRGKASDCVGCGRCARICPQHLKIPALMHEAAEVFEGKSPT